MIKSWLIGTTLTIFRHFFWTCKAPMTPLPPTLPPRIGEKRSDSSPHPRKSTKALAKEAQASILSLLIRSLFSYLEAGARSPKLLDPLQVLLVILSALFLSLLVLGLIPWSPVTVQGQ